MLDEGAGDLNSREFQERMEDLSMRMSYEEANDAFYGNFETLTENRDEAAKLLKLALNKPRFDADAVERIRQQLMAALVYAARDPDKVAQNQWYATGLCRSSLCAPGQRHRAIVGKMTRADLDDYRKRVFAKDTLKVVAVGDIDAEQLGKLLDEVFGDLPAKAELTPVSKTDPGHRRKPDGRRHERAAVGGRVRSWRHGRARTRTSWRPLCSTISSAAALPPSCRRRCARSAASPTACIRLSCR